MSAKCFLIGHPNSVGSSPFDTVVAPITGTQPAAVAWIRLSGSEAWSIAAQVFPNWPHEPKSHQAIFGIYSYGDSGLVLPFAQNHSYTGDESVEMSIHGSTVSSRKLIELCIANGARMAEPGEFTLRAFLNGRLDLTQAEAVKDTVDAQTDAQLRAANLNRKGVLKRSVEQIRGEVVRLLVRVEASVDFSEEIGELDHAEAIQAIQKQIEAIDHLLVTADAGRILRSGYRIAIVGAPNVGKSSLLNAILCEDRSIVTNIPGTTRDYVEERVELAGLPVVLIDTAGLRDTSDPVEEIGIQRTLAIAANADAVWYLYDAGKGWSSHDEQAIATFDRPTTILANKCDLAVPKRGLPISALTRQGLDELLTSIRQQVEDSSDQPLINMRHQPLLAQARLSLADCIASMEANDPDDLLSVLLTDVAQHLGAITGETAAPDMIERIFHDFCIGK